MIALPEMLVDAAVKAGMDVPTNVNKYNKRKFPHFTVFCNVQLGKSVRYHGEHFENAKIIAAIPDEEITKVTFDDLLIKGFIY